MNGRKDNLVKRAMQLYHEGYSMDEIVCMLKLRDTKELESIIGLRW